jgi:hypothetical protein
VAMEVRYIIFNSDEVRAAIVSFVLKQGQITTANDVISVEVVGTNETPTAVVQLQPSPATKPIKLADQYLVAALVLFCIDRRIPIPKKAAKKVALSVNGLTLEMTTDRSQGAPSVANTQISYGEIANRATERIGTVQEELARTLARAVHAEGLIAQADERARKAEQARAKSSGALTAVLLMPGVRGQIGRWLVKFNYRFSDQSI